jgi:hypothetical protein
VRSVPADSKDDGKTFVGLFVRELVSVKALAGSAVVRESVPMSGTLKKGTLLYQIAGIKKP